jgi:pyroglutamyl-peptidase
MRKILLTGFVPFSDVSVNPSETLVRDLHQLLKTNLDYQFEMMILPVDYKQVGIVINAIDFSEFDFAFHFGVARSRQRISLERVALNWMESTIPDNSGTHINRQQIDANAPAAVFNSLDLAMISEKINQKYNEDVTEVSFSAGAYVCNYVYYKAMSKTPNCLFIHIPVQPKIGTSDIQVSQICLETIRNVLKAI